MPRKAKTHKRNDEKRSSGQAQTAIAPETVTFHSIKSATFHSVYADAAWASLSPQGFVHLIFYNERAAVPMETVHRVTADGTLGAEIVEKRVGKVGVVRQMEVDVIMSRKAALEVLAWIAKTVGVPITANEANKPAP